MDTPTLIILLFLAGFLTASTIAFPLVLWVKLRLAKKQLNNSQALVSRLEQNLISERNKVNELGYHNSTLHNQGIELKYRVEDLSDKLARANEEIGRIHKCYVDVQTGQ